MLPALMCLCLTAVPTASSDDDLAAPKPVRKLELKLSYERAQQGEPLEVHAEFTLPERGVNVTDLQVWAVDPGGVVLERVKLTESKLHQTHVWNFAEPKVGRWKFWVMARYSDGIVDKDDASLEVVSAQVETERIAQEYADLEVASFNEALKTNPRDACNLSWLKALPQVASIEPNATGEQLTVRFTAGKQLTLACHTALGMLSK